MAVNKPGLHWSTYQDKQLDALTSIDRNLKKLLDVDSALSDDFSDIMESSTKSLITAINDIWNDNFTDINRYVPYIHRDTRRTADASEESTEQLEEIREGQEQGQRQNQMMLRDIGELLRNLDIEGYVRKAIDSANTYSELYNTIITMTGANGQEAQAFRRDMINIIEDLNDDLGSTLNPNRALEQMVAISASTNISNRETLKEIAEPILLAQQTMNINLSAIAELSGKMYTKYSFSSGRLERMVDTIRNSTDGQDVSEDLIVTALSRLDNNFAVYSEGDAEMLEKMNLGLIKGVSFLEANYIDSQTYLNDLADFLSPDVRDNASMVKKYGSEYAGRISAEAQAGNIDAALALMNEALDHMSIYEALARGFNRDDWMSANSDYKNLGLDALGEWKSALNDEATARETAEDKFVTIGDKIANELTGLTSYLATIQETIGIGFDDIGGLIITAQSLGRLLGVGGSAAGAGSLLGTLGPALGIAAGAVGVAALVASIYDVVKEDADKAGDPYQNALVDTESPYGYGFRGVYNDQTGKTDWSYSAFESAEEASAYDSEKAFQKYLEDTSKERSWWEKTVDYLSTAGWNSAAAYNPNMDATSSTWKSDQKIIYDAIKVLEEQVDPEVRAFYAGKDLLTDYGEIQKFAKNYEKYEDAYEDGMYLGANGEWYYVNDNKLVPKDLAPKKFANGTNYVTKDQLALIHEGEAITPKEYNPAANMNELERLRAEKDSSRDIAEMLGVISDIKDLLEAIKNENSKNSTVANNRNAIARLQISRYQV